MAYLTNLGIVIGMAALGVLSLNVAAGFTGLLNLGHAAIVGIGSYTTALLLLRAGAPLPVAMLAAVAMCALVALIVGMISRRLRGDTFAVLMLWFAFVVITILLNWTDLTRGALGLPGIRRPEILRDQFFFFLFVAFLVVLVYAFLRRITSSPFGRVMGAVRDDETASLVLGKDVFRVRLVALALSAALAALPGALAALYLGFIEPREFGLPLLIDYLFFLMVGGLASLEGGLLATAGLMLLAEALRFLQLDPDIVGALRQIIFAVILLAIIMFRPQGLRGRVTL